MKNNTDKVCSCTVFGTGCGDLPPEGLSEEFYRIGRTGDPFKNHCIKCIFKHFAKKFDKGDIGWDEYRNAALIWIKNDPNNSDYIDQLL